MNQVFRRRQQGISRKIERDWLGDDTRDNIIIMPINNELISTNNSLKFNKEKT